MIKIKKLSFKNLKNLNIQERIEAAKTPGIGQTLMSALTPTQIADLFPRYYLMREPDISGFLKAMPTGTTAAKQAAFQEQLNNTASGDAAGKNMEAGGWRRKLQEGVNRDTATVLKPGQAPQPKLPDEQMATIHALQGGENIASSDPRVKFIATLTPEQLKTVGLEKYKGEGDKEFFKYILPSPTDEEVKKIIKERSSIVEEKPARKAAEDYLGRSMTDNEWNLLLSTTKAEATSHKGETAMVMATILNRAKIGYGGRNTIEGVVSAYRQFSSWANGKATIPPTEKRRQSIIESTSLLHGISHRQLEFASANPRAYDTPTDGGGGERKIQDRLRRGFTQVGGQIFNAADKSDLREVNVKTDPITGDYRKEQVDAEREKLIRDINAKRITDLAKYSQADLPVPGSSEAQQFFTDGRSESAVRKRISEITGMESRECVALAKAYVGSTGSVSDWRRGGNVLDGNLQPGTPIATFMDREGNPSQYYDGGIGRGKRKNDTTHAAVFLGYERDQSGKITGIRVADQWATSGGVRFRTYPIEGKNRITSAKNFYAINDTKGEPLGESNPMRIMKQSQQQQGGPKSETVAEGRVKTSVVESAAQVTPDVKPGEHRPAPHGQHVLDTPPQPQKQEETKPVEAKNAEPPTIKKFVKGEGYAGIKDVPNPNYVPPKQEAPKQEPPKTEPPKQEPPKTEPPKTEPPKTGAVAEQRVQSSVANQTPDSKPNVKNPQPSGQNKVVEPIKTNAKGGENKTNTSEISAMPIGGLKDDNSVVVDSNQRPLFTMNTNKETAVYDPTERKVDVIPNQKPGQVGRAPEPGNDLQQQLDGLKADILGMNENTQAPAPQDAAKGSVSHISDRDPHMIEQIMDMTRNLFLDPSAARAFSRARFHETGDATNDFHHSSGNSNMQ